MVNVVLIDCDGSYLPQLEVAIKKHTSQVKTIPLAQANHFDFAGNQAVIVSGGPHLFTNPEICSKLTQQFRFLDELTKPVFGICLGHQALGIRSGVTAYRGEERRNEDLIRIVSDHELLEGLPSEFPMKEAHCEGIPLPEGFDKLACSEFYPVEIMSSRKAPHFGVQFHPEISGELGDLLFHNFFTIAKKF